jgi:hypothetical protein
MRSHNLVAISTPDLAAILLLAVTVPGWWRAGRRKC